MDGGGKKFTFLERRKIEGVSDEEFLGLFLRATGEEHDAVAKMLEEMPKDERDAITKKLMGGSAG